MQGEANTTQEMHAVEKGYTNTDADSKIKHSANGQNSQENVNKVTNYFFSHQQMKKQIKGRASS